MSSPPSILARRAQVQAFNSEFIKFIDSSVTPFHAVSNMKNMLQRSGFVGLHEGQAWPQLEKGGKYFVTRNDSSIVAFTVGGKFQPGNGFKITGAHTDSPNLALKPRTHVKKSGFIEVGVQPYGGGLWHTWFDRELTLAGRVIYKQEQTDPQMAPLRKALVHIRKPIMRIPNLCIHLTSAEERGKFAPDKENHVKPMIATEEMAKAVEDSAKANCPDDEKNAFALDKIVQRLLSEEVGCPISDILDFDMSLVDTQPSCIGGVYDEFVFAPRLDNLVSCYACIKALLDGGDTVQDDSMVRMCAMFDNEECGSASSQGAGGSMIPDILNRLCPEATQRSQTVANSFMISVDGAHGIHPNYADKHEPQHAPQLHQGPVIKYNANQRYATTGSTAATIKALAQLAGVPVQEFVIKNSSPCGSTIGPILTTLSGIKGVDLGNAMLSMHSIRETCGTTDMLYLYELMLAFYQSYDKAIVSTAML